MARNRSYIVEIWNRSDGSPGKLVTFVNQRDDAELDIREINKIFRAGVFGDEELDDIVMSINPYATNEQMQVNCSLDDALKSVCSSLNVSLEELASPRKDRRLVDARSVFSLLARKAADWNFEDVGRVLQKNSGTISKLASRAEASARLRGLTNKIIVE